MRITPEAVAKPCMFWYSAATPRPIFEAIVPKYAGNASTNPMMPKINAAVCSPTGFAVFSGFAGSMTIGC